MEAAGIASRPDSLWPSAYWLRAIVGVLVGLVLIAVLADGDLVTWLNLVLVVMWALLGLWKDRDRDTSESGVPLAVIVAPLCVAGVAADLVARGDWYVVVWVALALPLTVLTRIVMVLWWRREARRAT